MYIQIFTFSVLDDGETIPDCQIQVNLPTNISVTSANLPHPIQFNLFDNVRVSLKLRKSHAHRHMVYMTLVDLEHVQLQNRLTRTEMIQAIEIEEAAKENSTKKLSSKKKKKHTGSMYQVLEKFRKLAIVENTAHV